MRSLGLGYIYENIICYISCYTKYTSGFDVVVVVVDVVVVVVNC